MIQFIKNIFGGNSGDATALPQNDTSHPNPKFDNLVVFQVDFDGLG